MIHVALALTLALLASVSGTLRADNERIADALRLMLAGSPTFARMAGRIAESDVIVYLTIGRCPRPVRSCLRLMGAGGGHRYVRITVSVAERLDVVVAQVAHELQHAVEIADAAEVSTARQVAALYRVIGYQTALADTFETDNAIAMEKRVVRELRAAARDAEQPRSARRTQR